jgi:hypothetical protein
MQAMGVNGQVVSVLLDIVWQGVRYNFQSGYSENRYPKIALGALHMGFAIEQALGGNQAYDFMAGTGKNSNYKARIANSSQPLCSYQIERGHLKLLRQLQEKLQINREKS